MEDFLGHSMQYWLTLKQEASQLGVTHLLEEIADLRSKVSFYESRITEMNAFKKTMRD